MKKLFAAVAVIASAILIPASLMAWGPTRPTYNAANPADHITFNSITDNPNVGDERNFVTIKEASNTGYGGWTDKMNVQPGKEYLVNMYIHNNAASNLNLVAQNTRVMATVPNTTGKKVTVEGFLTADNATPKQIWDQAEFLGDTDFNITYVPGSAKLYNKVFTGGTTLSDGIVTSNGALVGYDKLDGKIPGCFEYSGYVTFKVKADAPKVADFSATKQVRKSGETEWKKSIAVKPGDNVEYQISYKNTGATRQNNVTLRDTLPAGINYVDGSTYLRNGTNPNGLKISDNITKPVGVNVGDYSPNANAHVKFGAKVTGDNLVCGPNTLTNKVRVAVDDRYREDTADVTINKECAPGEISVCELATKRIITIQEKDFDSNLHSKNLLDCTDAPLPPELPQTGVSGSALTLAGIGLLTAAAAYAVRSDRVRNLLRG